VQPNSSHTNSQSISQITFSQPSISRLHSSASNGTVGINSSFLAPHRLSSIAVVDFALMTMEEMNCGYSDCYCFLWMSSVSGIVFVIAIGFASGMLVADFDDPDRYIHPGDQR